MGDFRGAKLALFVGARLLVIRRDDRADIAWPDRWDFPGGGREGDESALECALRETREEVGLVLSEADVVWERSYRRAGGVTWFFVAHLPEGAEDAVVFGDEGQGWALMDPGAYCADAKAIPHFVERLEEYLEASGRKTPRGSRGGR